jgi:hypothetical protein
VATRLGDARVTTIDIAPYLVKAAEERLARTGLHPLVAVAVADATGPLPGSYEAGPRRLWDIADDIRHAWLTDGTLPAYGAAITISPDGGIRLVKGRWQAEIPASSAPGLDG